MHDLVMRGGPIGDGTGRERFTGDLAIDDGVLAAGGRARGRGRREIDATELLVTPGWVDVHTHHDGQATWDPILAPSSWHGVTTLVQRVDGYRCTAVSGAVSFANGAPAGARPAWLVRGGAGRVGRTKDDGT
jgi:N-acyl-D-aspartate/D-glutamate deacylase